MASPPRQWRAGTGCVPIVRRPWGAGCSAIWPRASRAWRSDPVAGASPLFPPRYPTAALAREALLQVVRQAPALWGLEQTRWTLRSLLGVCDWLRLRTTAGLAGLLRRLRITWQRGRSYIHSPDRDYAAKWAAVQGVRRLVEAGADESRLVYLDEVTVTRQPTLAPAWAGSPGEQPRACRSTCADTLTRVVASLDHQTGQVCFRRATRIGLAALVAFYRQLVAAYPQATRIYVVLDNWPLHRHPDLLAALEPQETPWLLPLPPSWPTTPSASALRRWGHLQLPIQLVPLPTYASWLNPIEKLWRKLRGDLTHLHRHADDLATLRDRVDAFLAGFDHGSDDLLRYVGLRPDPARPATRRRTQYSYALNS
jgi:transposase